MVAYCMGVIVIATVKVMPLLILYQVPEPLLSKPGNRYQGRQFQSLSESDGASTDSSSSPVIAWVLRHRKYSMASIMTVDGIAITG